MLLSLALVSVLVLAACDSPPRAAIDVASPLAEIDDAALASGADDGDWVAFGRTFAEQRFSPLAQVTADNAEGLGVAWYTDLPNDRTLYGTPLVVDGVMYYEGSWNVLRAVDATSGALLWEYDPEVIEHAGDRLRIMWDASRGIAIYEGKIFVATVDGRLIAIDAGTGEELWSTMTLDPLQPLMITGAPKAFRGLVVIGNGGTEWGPTRGYVDAYHAETGERAWRWWVVPGNPADGFENEAMAIAAETWTGEWWEHGGGGNVWHGITYDPDFDQLLIGTGNGSPWNQRIRSPGGGDNLFLSSVVALDATSGGYKWHYQTTPGETWDYNSNMDIVLADLEIGGRDVKAALHAPKNGFFYVIDRADGSLISAQNFADITWATGIDPQTGRPIEAPGARYQDSLTLVWPGPLGAHSWHAMSFNPVTGLAYIPAMDIPGGYGEETFDTEDWESPDWRFDSGVDPSTTDVPADFGTGSLKAWDPVTQTLAWEAEKPGIASAGTLTTEGNLVFQGQADGRLVAHRADTGEEVWSGELGLGVAAPPITYSVDGRQYVAILVGWGGAGPAFMGSLVAKHGWAYKAQSRRLIAFALGADVALPPTAPPVLPEPLADPDFVAEAELAERGGITYAEACAMCHGAGAVSGGVAPDLRASPMVLAREVFMNVVLGGDLIERGMPRFAEGLTEFEADGVRHYIRAQAAAHLEAAQAEEGAP